MGIFPKPKIIREYGKCKVRYINSTSYELVEKEITEEEFLEYKRKWKSDGDYTISDYNDTSDIRNPNVFTYSWIEKETEYEKNITKNSVISFAKYIFKNEDNSIKKINYLIILIDNETVYLPNEDIYNSFCKWMKGENK